MAQPRFGRFEPVGISEDEWELLDLLRQGLSHRAIAHRLGLPDATIRFKLDNVAAKLRLLAQMWGEPGRPR